MENHSEFSATWLTNKVIKNITSSKGEKRINNNKLTNEIRTAIDELETARKYFETVDDPELIEYAIYREKAAIIRLSYLFKEAKISRYNKE